MPPVPDVEVFVPPRILRERFNASQIPALIEGGNLIAQYKRDDHLQRPETVGEQWCTRGQMVRYMDEQGLWMVEVFQYRRSDGSLGASGRPDPKRMRVDREVWIAER